MSDIELVVRISEEDLDCIKYLKAKGWASKHELQILNGTPLPKGHGRLIDAGEYVDVLNNAQIEGLNTYEGLGRAKELLIETHTIIEADKE